MFGGRFKQLFLILAFIATICSVGLSQLIFDLVDGQIPQIAELFMQKPTRANLRAFETDLQDNCRLTKKLRPWIQCVQFIILGELGDKVVVGHNRWLFYRPAVQYLIEPWSPETDRVQGDIFSAITSFRDQLAERGIKLLVAPVPNKASVYPDMLTRRAKHTEKPVNYKTLEIISLLRQAGIEVVDLFATFRYGRSGLIPDENKNYYLYRDSHWSPVGMRLAAKTVGQKILELGWVEKGQTEYTLKPVEVKWQGDILRMIQVPQVENMFEQERIKCVQVVKAATQQPYQDDPPSEVLVLGDSFCRIYSQDEPSAAGFAEHLAYELGSAVTSIVNDGGASTLVRQQLSRNPNLFANKKVVVWQFVERDIRFGTEGWQIVPLP
ncbi:MAG: hypothetical protein AMJ75_09200 [Phycisphaerae bacterium SM1_79]|nr:MAG: hypothetical protein AMJ75_09200 [Phycisphaerae bacterium SM1_79]